MIFVSENKHKLFEYSKSFSDPYYKKGLQSFCLEIFFFCVCFFACLILFWRFHYFCSSSCWLNLGISWVNQGSINCYNCYYLIRVCNMSSTVMNFISIILFNPYNYPVKEVLWSFVPFPHVRMQMFRELQFLPESLN